jgi:hypothetical protein
MYHKHHIIPKHMGGTDEKENITTLTVEEHAEAHRILYEEHGKLEDYLAWKGLLGQISKKEILTEIYRKNGSKQGKNNKGKRAWNKDLPMSEEQKQKLSVPKSEKHKEALRKPKSKKEKMGKYERTLEIREKIRENTKNQFATEESRLRHSESVKSVKAICIYCGLTTVPGNINRWHNENCKKKPS